MMSRLTVLVAMGLILGCSPVPGTDPGSPDGELQTIVGRVVDVDMRDAFVDGPVWFDLITKHGERVKLGYVYTRDTQTTPLTEERLKLHYRVQSIRKGDVVQVTGVLGRDADGALSMGIRDAVVLERGKL